MAHETGIIEMVSEAAEFLDREYAGDELTREGWADRVEMGELDLDDLPGMDDDPYGLVQQAWECEVELRLPRYR